MDEETSLNASSTTVPTRTRVFYMNDKRRTPGEYGQKSESTDKTDGDTVKSRLLSAWNNVRFGKMYTIGTYLRFS